MTSQLLQYAQHYSLTIDHRSTDVMDLVDKIKSQYSLSEYRMQDLVSEDTINDHEDLILEEKLTVTMEETKYLQDILKSSTISGLPGHQQWSPPDYGKLERLKVPIPLFTNNISDEDRDVRRVRAGVDFWKIIQSIRGDCMTDGAHIFTQNKAMESEQHSWMAYFQKCSAQVQNEVMNEKLQVTPELLFRLKELLRPSGPDVINAAGEDG